MALDETRPHVASVDVRGSVRDVNIGIIVPDRPGPGTWVDIHMGMAVAILDPAEAKASLEFLEELEAAAGGVDER